MFYTTFKFYGEMTYTTTTLQIFQRFPHGVEGHVEEDPKDELHHLRFQKYNGNFIVRDKGDMRIPTYYHRKLTTWAVNIGVEGSPKMKIFCDYWDEHIVVEVVALLKEYEDIFLQNFIN